MHLRGTTRRGQHGPIWEDRGAEKMQVVQMGERAWGGGPPRACVLCLAEMSGRVSVADGFCWFQGLWLLTGLQV